MKAACVVLLLFTLLPVASHSQSLFDGTWVVVSSKTENEKPKPISFLVVDGVYRSADRVLKADGKDHEVPVTGYWDTVSVLIVDEHTVEVTSKKAGKAMFTETDTVSEDGNTLTQVVRDIADSDEGNQYSGLVVISIPGWRDQSSERSDAGFCIL